MTVQELRQDADRREALARAATQGGWRVARDDENPRVVGDHLIEVAGWVVARGCDKTEANHIAANDPAAVLRQCERDRLLADFAATVQDDNGYDSEALHAKLGALMQRFFKLAKP